MGPSANASDPQPFCSLSGSINDALEIAFFKKNQQVLYLKYNL